MIRSYFKRNAQFLEILGSVFLACMFILSASKVTNAQNGSPGYGNQTCWSFNVESASQCFGGGTGSNETWYLEGNLCTICQLPDDQTSPDNSDAGSCNPGYHIDTTSGGALHCVADTPSTPTPPPPPGGPNVDPGCIAQCTSMCGQLDSCGFSPCGSATNPGCTAQCTGNQVWDGTQCTTIGVGTCPDGTPNLGSCTGHMCSNPSTHYDAASATCIPNTTPVTPVTPVTPPVTPVTPPVTPTTPPVGVCPTGQYYDGVNCVDGDTNFPATITVSEVNASGVPITGGYWIVEPANFSSTAAGNFTTTPSPRGTTETLTASPLAGYGTPIVNSHNDGGVSSGSSILAYPGDRISYLVVYPAANPADPNDPNNNPSPSFSYSLSAPTASATRGIDQYAQTTVTKSLTSGSSQAVTLSLSGVPSGVTYSFDGNQACSPDCASAVTFTIPVSVTPGTYSITVTGTPGNITTNFNLVINPSPAMFVSCGVTSATPAKAGVPVTWQASVSGGVPPYTYAWSGSSVPTPSPTTNPLNITYTTVGQKSAQATVTDKTGATATCAAASVQVNFNPDFKEI